MFDLLIFDDEATALLRSFEICTKMHFVSLFSLSERKLQPHFDDTFKTTVI